MVRRKGVSHREVLGALRAAGLHIIEALDEGDHSHFAFASGTPSKAVPAILAKVLRRRVPPVLERSDTEALNADNHGVLWSDLPGVSE
jgi:hypothetical protein